MDAANVARPAAISAQAASVRAENLASVNRIKTELPKTETVTNVTASPSVRLDLSNEARNQARREAMLREAIQRNISIDPQTRTVVIQAVNPASGEILRQFPTEATLQLRAYYRQMMEADGADKKVVARYRERPKMKRTA